MGVIQYAQFIPLLASGVVDPYPGYLVYDTFTDANGTALTAHTPDKRPGSNAWTALRGTWQVQSNRGKLTTSGGDGQNVCAIDAGDADVTVDVQLVTNVAGDADSGLIVNVVDTNNYWLFTLLAGGTCVLYEHVGGGFVARGGSHSFSWVAGSTYAVRVVTAGDSIDCFIDGVAKQSYTTAGRPLKTATLHGIRSFVTDANSAFDNFSVAA
jgi:hypothetical protein